MLIDAWLPLRFRLPDGIVVTQPVAGTDGWQIWDNDLGGRSLLALGGLHERWVRDGLLEQDPSVPVSAGGMTLRAFSASATVPVTYLGGARPARDVESAMAIAEALRATRACGCSASLHDAVFVASLRRLLPGYASSGAVPDEVVLGMWLTGGVAVSVRAGARIRALTGWMNEEQLQTVVATAGLLSEVEGGAQVTPGRSASGFRLPGRPELEGFFREHVIEIVEHAERYRAVGIEFPSAFVLHGPPGCGKTFAVERLVEYLGWPCHRIDSGAVGSPFIHETSRKVAQVFAAAMEEAPSVLMIDEMEAFLSDRATSGAGQQHRVEEVAEFLRRIPEAAQRRVLVVAMTNHIDMIDPAILRRGRFDHVVGVGMASREEIESMLQNTLGRLPLAPDLSLGWVAGQMDGRPLSDVAFVVREAARLAARDGDSRIGRGHVEMAVKGAPRRDVERRTRIGFARDPQETPDGG